MRIGMLAACVGLAATYGTSPAWAGACGAVPCSTRTAVKGNSVVPPPDGSEFRNRGDLFTSQFTDVGLAANGSRQVDLGFSVNFGFGAVSTLFLNENGLVSFLRPISAAAGSPIAATAISNGIGFQSVASLNQFGVPVIAPFYANLVQGAGAGDGQLGFGDIVVQYGFADPYADQNGQYDRADARSAVRITWYGLTVASNQAAAAASAQQVFAQLLLSSDLDGASSFEFRYGPLDNPGQEGYGSIAGFSLGSNFQQFSGPYVDGSPTFFEFQDGVYVGQAVGAPVPEPATWAMLMLGFGAIGFAMRRRGVTTRLRYT